jgi:hypothetical protein
LRNLYKVDPHSPASFSQPYSSLRNVYKRLHALIRHSKGNCIISLPHELQKWI